MQYVTTLLGAGVSKAPGLHESATATGNTGSRAQTASEFARLERERVRLEEKLNMQAVIAAQTQTRLESIHRSLDVVRRQLDEIPAEADARAAWTPRPAAPQAVAAVRPAPGAAQAEEEEEDDFMQPWAVIPFEY
jgi:hypothetical protein